MRRRAFVLLGVILLAGCMEGPHPKPLPRTPSLYTQMGGAAKLTEVVNRFMALAGTRAVAAGSSELREPIRAAFTGSGAAELKQKLTRDLGAALGGPYPGTVDDLGKTLMSLADDMKPTDLEALLNVLDRAMQECNLDERTRKEVMEALEPLKTPAEKPADEPKD